ncbi:MAG: metallophosphoesterase [Proteobacteria bacterium]|nr:metallophosphoesterase [Pseudomonadota bacterium]
MNYFFLILLAAQAVLGAYLGWRFRWAFGGVLPSRLMLWYVFWPLVAVIVMSFPLVHFFSRRLGVELPPWLLLASAVLYGALVMGLATVFIADMFGLIIRRLPFLQAMYAYVRQHPHHLGFLMLGIIILLTVVGFYRAHTPRETHFSLTVHKPLKNGATQLRIVQLSDLHISRYSSIALMQEAVARVNRLQPDMIFITGDTIDSSVKPYFEQEMPRLLGELKSRYGVYTIMSNHDYYGESPKRNIDAYTRSNMHVLRDEVLYLEEPGITLIGRDDRARGSRTLPPGVSSDIVDERAPLAVLAARADPAMPWILLDHQPHEIDEAVAQKIDLQFSGHTHGGQFFPLNIIVKALFKDSWGLLTQGDYSLIVTCGLGTWGPPLRFPSYAEIVVADISFQPAEP